MGEDRRCYARACGALEVTLDVSGRKWQGKTVNLGPYGAKVALSGKSVPLAPGTIIGLRLTLPDGDLSLAASVCRTDADGVALNFGNLEAREFQRLKNLVDALLVQEWRELLTELQGGPQEPATVPSSGDPPLHASVPSSDRDVMLPELPQSPLPESPRAQPTVAASQPSVFARQRGRATPPKPSETPAGDESETERLQALLSRLGLGNLQLPPGPLTGHWREFLKRHEAQ